MLDLPDIFKKWDDEFLKFERILTPRHPRPDVCAFLLLHDLVPTVGVKRDMVSAAEHDEIWLDTDLDALATHATEADIVTLIRCGVRLDDEVDSLAMYV